VRVLTDQVAVTHKNQCSNHEAEFVGSAPERSRVQHFIYALSLTIDSRLQFFTFFYGFFVGGVCGEKLLHRFIDGGYIGKVSDVS
jgi:hypothetical protein